MNAWANGPVFGDVPLDLDQHILSQKVEGEGILLPEPEAPEQAWWDDRVGWGLVLADDPTLSAADRATPKGAPKAIQDLHEHRGGPIFRIGKDWTPGFLRRHYPGGRTADLQTATGHFGAGEGRIPKYLLIVGEPDQIPWEAQYDLQQGRYVGRLPGGAELRTYVDALISGWDNQPPEPANTLVWSVDHGGEDITGMMQSAIARPLHALFRDDQSDAALRAGARLVQGDDATHGNLTAAINQHRPSLIATTSHGNTWPIDQPARMAASLGLLIDDDHQAIDPASLRDTFAPYGAVWYAQACCSAGSTAQSGYKGVLVPGSRAAKVTEAVAECGDTFAPLPRALLTSERPLAAFIGHVEPTFDWSIRQPQTGQIMTHSIMKTFFFSLYTGKPIGMAMDHIRRTGGSFLAQADLSSRELIRGAMKEIGTFLAISLASRDWQSIVLLGDPTVTVYPPQAQVQNGGSG